MRTVIQRVSKASRNSGWEVISRIGTGLLVLLGVEDADTRRRRLAGAQDHSAASSPDERGLMNKSIQDVGGDLLVVSQFTLFRLDQKKATARVSSLRPTRSCHTFVRRVRAAGRKPAGQTGGHRIIRRHDGSGPGEQRTGYHHHRHKRTKSEKNQSLFRDTPDHLVIPTIVFVFYKAVCLNTANASV